MHCCCPWMYFWHIVGWRRSRIRTWDTQSFVPPASSGREGNHTLPIHRPCSRTAKYTPFLNDHIWQWPYRREAGLYDLPANTKYKLPGTPGSCSVHVSSWPCDLPEAVTNIEEVNHQFSHIPLYFPRQEKVDIRSLLLLMFVPTTQSSVDKASFSFQFPRIGHESLWLDGYFSFFKKQLQGRR